jgi:hypothetical protein
MLRHVSTHSLSTRATWSLVSFRPFSQAVSPAFDASPAQERQRERRRKERAEAAPTIAIEGTTEVRLLRWFFRVILNEWLRI